MMHQPRTRRPAFQRALRVATLLLALAWPAQALACGIPLGANGSSAHIPSEQALIMFAGGRETIISSVNLNSDQGGAAVVFPVPGIPQVEALKSNNLFTYLEEATKPELVFTTRPCGLGGGAAAPPAGGVSVLGRETIGGYDVARLAADDPKALSQWLDQNGYKLPPAAAPILKAYTDEGWKFVAVKLANRAAVNGTLMPLRITFESQEIVYPMRLDGLADHVIDVLLYVLADHRVTIPDMQTQYAGPVAALPAPPADLAPIFTAPYLTKLRNQQISPASLTADFVAQPVADDPYRQTITEVRCSAILSIGLILAVQACPVIIVVVIVVFVVRLLLRRRSTSSGPRKY